MRELTNIVVGEPDAVALGDVEGEAEAVALVVAEPEPEPVLVEVADLVAVAELVAVACALPLEAVEPAAIDATSASESARL